MSGPSSSGIRPVHVVWHLACLAHDPGIGHPESPQRLRAILDALRNGQASVPLIWHEAAPATEAALERVHPAAYLERLRLLAAEGGGPLDEDTFMSPASFEAARMGAGAAMQAADLALQGHPAFAAVRPPGHHALADTAMGFCLINNVVVAARHALTRGAARVLIVDWDVHHGNGTQALVEADPAIRYVSLHQWPLYPGTGRAEERGVGNIFNVPRPPGLPRERYVADLDAAVREATRGWAPDLILVSAGFDAMAGDPLAGFTLEPDDYATWLRSWRSLQAPIATVLEGGYAPDRIARAAVRHIEALG
ncbi:MAG TPA: histone deacetylase [Gemmatimonadales bacterium]